MSYHSASMSARCDLSWLVAAYLTFPPVGSKDASDILPIPNWYSLLYAFFFPSYQEELLHRKLLPVHQTVRGFVCKTYFHLFFNFFYLLTFNCRMYNVVGIYFFSRSICLLLSFKYLQRRIVLSSIRISIFLQVLLISVFMSSAGVHFNARIKKQKQEETRIIIKLGTRLQI